MNKWQLLKNIRKGLEEKKISMIEALGMLHDAIKMHIENNADIEYEVFINELKKLKLLTEKINIILEENTLLGIYNEKLLQFAQMSDKDLEKHRRNILRML